MPETLGKNSRVVETVGDIIYLLKNWSEDLANDGQVGVILAKVLRILNYKEKWSLKNQESRDKIIGFLSSNGIPNLSLKDLAAGYTEEQRALGSRALDAQILNKLLVELDEHEAKRDPTKEAGRLARWLGVKPEAVLGILKRKWEIQAVERAKLGNEELAARVTDSRLVVEARLKEEGIDEGTIQKTVEVVAGAVGGTRIIETLDKKLPSKIKDLVIEEVVKIVAGKEIKNIANKLINEVAAIKPLNPQASDKIRGLVEAGLVGEDETELTERIVEMAEIGEEVKANELGVAVRRAKTEIKTRGGEIVRRYQGLMEAEEAVAEIRRENPELTGEQLKAVEKYGLSYARWQSKVPKIEIKPAAIEAEINGMIEKGKISNEERLTATQIRLGVPRVESIAKVIRTPLEKVNKMVGIRARLEKLGVRFPVIFKNPRFDSFNQVNEMVMKNPGMKNLLGFVHRSEVMMAGWVGEKLAMIFGLESIAGKSVSKWAAQTMLAIKRYGPEKGTVIAMRTMALKLGTKLGAESLAGKALIWVATKLGALGGPPGWVVTMALMAVQMAIGVIKKVGEKAREIAAAMGINIPKIKDFLAETLGLGKIGRLLGAIPDFLVDLGLTAGMFLGFLFGLIGTISATAVIGPVIVFLFIGMIGYNHWQTASTQVSGLVPPQIGGGCVLLSSLSALGEANCKQNTPKCEVEGVDRENFFRLADAWSGAGKINNNARRCYDDVLQRAKAAGVNPVWALWVWLHESGASNYEIEKVEDFGMHLLGEVGQKNFNAQIDAFLQIEPGRGCGSGDYWLNVSSDFLTGQCDPDTGTTQTGRSYEADLREQWPWIAPGKGMPSSIKDLSGYEVSCGGTANKDVIQISDAGIGQTDVNGNPLYRGSGDWVCYGGETEGSRYANIEIPAWDPNSLIPAGCPNRLPISGAYFTQGPFAQSCTHAAMSVPAIDIGVGNGTEIRASHPGNVELGYDDIYGFFVDLHGNCEGKDFVTRYAHMPQWLPGLKSGQIVKAGETIGVVNDSGSSSGPHLHYDIRGLTVEKFGQYLGLDYATTKALWGCCQSCPAMP